MIFLFNVGCSGINAGGTVSPAMFFIPGFTMKEEGKTNIIDYYNSENKTVINHKSSGEKDKISAAIVQY
ncbi:MAG: hypothetical protein ACP5MG_06600 [Verrucomicrobiia bacterium]